MSFTIPTLHENPRMDALTNVQRLRWVLEFIRRDLEALPPETVETLGDDLRHATASYWVKKHSYCDDMSAAEVRALQEEIRAGIDAVMGDAIDFTEMAMIHLGHSRPQKGWVFPEAVTSICRVQLGSPRSPCLRVVRISEATNDRMAILSGVANLLVVCGDRLSTCPVCKTPFLRQYRQDYCTVRCSNKVRNRRRLDRKAEQKKSQRHDATRAPDTASLTTA
jgi:hypothetical protein